MFSCYNFFTGCQILAFGVFDKDVPENVVHSYPTLYAMQHRKPPVVPSGSVCKSASTIMTGQEKVGCGFVGVVFDLVFGHL